MAIRFDLEPRFFETIGVGGVKCNRRCFSLIAEDPFEPGSLVTFNGTPHLCCNPAAPLVEGRCDTSIANHRTCILATEALGNL